jgi:hypothetical protein
VAAAISILPRRSRARTPMIASRYSYRASR